MWICIGFNADPEPAYLNENADPDPRKPNQCPSTRIRIRILVKKVDIYNEKWEIYVTYTTN
jgi:hypothetical protein